MNMEKDKRLIEKYLDGQTSLSEEQKLFNDSDIDHPTISPWAKYVNHKKIQAPANLNTTLWNPENYSPRKSLRKYIAILIITILLVVTGILISNSHQSKELDYATKKSLLDQAIAMTAPIDPTPQQKEILYEDELIIIYIPRP